MDRQEHWRKRYGALRPGWTPSTDIYASLIDERLREDGSVLDIGCGHADLLRDTLARTANSYGIDVDADAVARNTTIGRKAVAAAEHIPFRDSSFDLVVMAWVLEHLVRPSRVFAEINRVLRADGKVIFITPNAWNYNAWLIRLVPNAFHARFTERLYGRAPSDTFPTRYRMNSIPRIESSLSRLGYERERIVTNGDPTYVAFNAPLFRVAAWLERLYDLPGLRQARVHIIGVYRKRGDAPSDRSSA